MRLQSEWPSRLTLPDDHSSQWVTGTRAVSVTVVKRSGRHSFNRRWTECWRDAVSGVLTAAVDYHSRIAVDIVPKTLVGAETAQTISSRWTLVGLWAQRLAMGTIARNEMGSVGRAKEEEALPNWLSTCSGNLLL